MDFSHVNQGGRKSGRFLLVAAVHVALGAMFVNGLNSRTITLTPDPGTIVDILKPKTIEPKPDPEPPKPRADLEPPKMVIPKPEVVVDPVVKPDIVTEYVDDRAPRVITSGPGLERANPEPPPVAPPARPAGMHQAVLANADACALPAYPKSSIRNEETGTTTLALLVGTDGRVTSARVEQSSGYRDLDRAAVSALSLCQFKPATTNGVPEAAWAKLSYVWTLN